MSAWIHGLGAAVVAGVVVAGADWVQNGLELSKTGLYKGLSAVVAAALVAAGAYLKQSPLSPK